MTEDRTGQVALRCVDGCMEAGADPVWARSLLAASSARAHKACPQCGAKLALVEHAAEVMLAQLEHMGTHPRGGEH